ncbi:MAG: GNAT family N-acetyltransferase [Candidatus Dormibacteria bacterium]
MPVTVRPVRDDEYERYGSVAALGFGADYDAEEQEQERLLIPLEDTLAAFDGDELVGTEGAYRLTLSIPGNQVPMAGVTTVSVLPTHTRRGVLTAMMRRRLETMRDAGEWLAGLWASESVIYGRYGYGVATERLGFEVDTSRTGYTRLVPDPGTTRLVDRDAALRTVPAIFDACAAACPGMVSRDGAWWNYLWRDPKEERAGRSGLLFAIHATNGLDDGYAVYRTKSNWGTGADNDMLLEDLVTTSDAAYAALWRYLFDVDLMPRLAAHSRPVDEPLLWMLADRRAVRPRVDEGLWLRLVSVPAALEGRRYSAEGRVVFEVADDFCPWNAGRYALTVSADGARCQATSETADIAAPAAALASAYLGGISFFNLGRAGRVTELVPGALQNADAMFRWHRAPWCDRIF